MINFIKQHKSWIYVGTAVFGTALLGAGLPLLLTGGYHQVTYIVDNATKTEYLGLLNYNVKLNNDVDFITFASTYRNANKRNELKTLINSNQAIIDSNNSNVSEKESARNAIKYWQGYLDIPHMYDMSIAGAIFISFGMTGLIGGASFLIDLHKNKLFNKTTKKLK